jgi:hypothetical protein
MDINSLMPTQAANVQKQQTAGLVKKWQRTGLLEGLSKEYEKQGMAVLLENQAKQLVSEANSTGTVSNSEEWSGVALPLVRRIFAEIAAKDFVSVQPMNLPSGLVFFLDFKYGTSQPGFNTSSGKDSQDDSVFGVTNTDLSSGTDAAVEGLYGAGRYGYSINEATTSDLEHGALTGASAFRSGTFSSANAFQESATSLAYDDAAAGQTAFERRIGYDAAFSASLSGADLALFQDIVVASQSLTNVDHDGVRAFTISGSGISTFYPQFTRVVESTGTTGAAKGIAFLVKRTAVGSGIVNDVEVKYHKAPTDVTRGDFEDGANGVSIGSTSNSALDIPEINLEMRSEAIVAKTRKLKAVWTPEFAQDLNAYHSIDAEAELTSMLSEYVSQEIDLEILDMLITNAQTTDRWSAKIGFEFDAATGGFLQSNATAQAYNQGTWFQTLGTKIQKTSNKIHQLTLRGGANFLVCSPTVATILESIPGYAADTDGDKAQFAMGVQKVGSINSRFQVYKNPYMTENKILMGYRGSQFLETGAVYAPYIPLIMTPLVYDPNSFTPRKGVMTRYAKKMVRPEFYGTIDVDGLDTV